MNIIFKILEILFYLVMAAFIIYVFYEAATHTGSDERNFRDRYTYPKKKES